MELQLYDFQYVKSLNLTKVNFNKCGILWCRKAVSEFACLPDNGMVILKQAVLKPYKNTVVLDWNIQLVVFNARFITSNYTL